MIELRGDIEALDTCDLSRPERLTILCGQLTLLRMRGERDIPVSAEAISRAETLARTLVIEEVLI